MISVTYMGYHWPHKKYILFSPLAFLTYTSLSLGLMSTVCSHRHTGGWSVRAFFAIDALPNLTRGCALEMTSSVLKTVFPVENTREFCFILSDSRQKLQFPRLPGPLPVRRTPPAPPAAPPPGAATVRGFFWYFE